MSDSMTKMAEMCQTMMSHEKAAIPYVIGASALFSVLLLVALVLLIVLEVVWITYWVRILKDRSPHERVRELLKPILFTIN